MHDAAVGVADPHRLGVGKLPDRVVADPFWSATKGLLTDG